MPMMKCGHAAQGLLRRPEGDIPACVICAPDPDAYTVDDTPPDLTGRRAKCSYRKRRDGQLCTSEVDSSPNEAFFEYRPDEPFDRYYCGCWGWD